MQLDAWYNEIDRFCCDWLSNLMDAGHITPGVICDRSIEDVSPAEVAGFRRVHFFAGLGAWDYALTAAGWGDRPIWTGSAPCQPFSSAGKGGGMGDERHLWPALLHLIEQRKPAICIGEQVASKDAEPWLDLVQTDLEILGYTFGCVPFPAASVGAPHIRDRLYWVAHSAASGRQQGRGPDSQQRARHGLANDRKPCGLAHSSSTGLERGDQGAVGHEREAVERGGGAGGLGHAAGRGEATGEQPGHLPGGQQAGPTRGFWADADWLPCRDGKWRPVSPLPQPLVDGSSESLGRVRPETIAEVEREVNEATAQTESGRVEAMRALLDELGAEAQCCWPAGGVPGLHEAPFLLAFMCQLQEQGWRVAEGVSLPRSEATSGELRSLWDVQAAAGAPRERGLDEQRPDERADPVRLLSRILARHASEAWGDAYAAHAEACFPLAKGARSRVGRLRAYGNAIVAPQAQVWVETVMDCLA